MSDERLVMALLAEGNPATEVTEDASTEVPAATYLATLEQRSRDMTQLETKKHEQESKRPWTTPWLVAAIAVIVLGVAAIMVNQAGVPAIPLAGADGDPQAVEAFRAVEAAYHAFNTGDPVWVEVRDRGSNPSLEEAEQAESLEGSALFSANQEAWDEHIAVSGCVSSGFGDWSEVTNPGVPTPTGYLFICEVIETNSFWSSGGLRLPATYMWVVDEEGVVAVSSREDFSQVNEFDEAFGKWLEETHPEVAADIIPLDPAYFPPEVGHDLWSHPESAPTALDYAEEFVAQSDDYPIESNS